MTHTNITESHRLQRKVSIMHYEIGDIHKIPHIISIKCLFKNYNRRNNSGNLENINFLKTLEIVTLEIQSINCVEALEFS